MTTALYRALRYQAASCADLGSPFMARLLRLLADRLSPGTPLTDRLFAWDGDLGPAGDSVPLRLAGALHALKLGGDPALAAVYPPHDVPDARLWQAVAQVLHTREPEIGRILDSPPQTNEVRRSAAILSALAWLGARWPGPATLSELGASAGLNLMADRFALLTPDGRLGAADPALTLTPDWRSPPPRGAVPSIAGRRGCDLLPLDPSRDRLRILSYIWPDQPERLRLTSAALSVAEPVVDKADAAAWIEDRLAGHHVGLHMVCNTIAWQYFPTSTRERARAAIEAAGARATPETPLAWLAMENDGATPGAALTLRLWPGGELHDLGRIDFHGRWIDWRAAPL
ncbi:DUF2332 domain-containing protein [Histidinibacterium lentulum]|uniref:DUF2332 family protein n=1 Tax=Histidinibacterium lentulum TaxID=2480588 RepID=A0A3N2R147_9RHOB|nr:DUF2332 family protein [Histidinibacterium lentulum]ROU01103.1 DUF2332 family protein [Histidinibacterium lentulum]